MFLRCLGSPIRYAAALLAVARRVARALALAMDLPEGFFAERMHDPPAQTVLLKYPPSQVYHTRSSIPYTNKKDASVG